MFTEYPFPVIWRILLDLRPNDWPEMELLT